MTTMKKLTVKDYAVLEGINRQAVYKRIKKGLLKSEKIGGKIFIVVDNNTTTMNPENNFNKNSNIDFVSVIIKQNEDLRKDVEFLKSQLKSLSDSIQQATIEKRETNQILRDFQMATGLLENNQTQAHDTVDYNMQDTIQVPPDLKRFKGKKKKRSKSKGKKKK